MALLAATSLSASAWADQTGTLDPSFGNGTNGGGDNAMANGITAQGDRLILVGGGSTSGNGNSNIALMRLLAK